MFPDGPTTTTVAPPFGLAAREYATHASASFRAVSRLISCRCARLVASGDIVTCASVKGGFCGAGSGGLVCADTCIDAPTMSTASIRNVILTRLPSIGRSGGTCASAASTTLSRQLRLTREDVGVFGVHVRVDRLIAHSVSVLV